MALSTHVLLMYGYVILFFWILVEQFGVPLPATPLLIAAGALSAEHRFSFGLALMLGVTATLMADTTWFLVGRRVGHHVLRLLCKLSLEPTVCVRKTQDSFGRRREITIMFAKFVPGLAMLAAPVAGENGMALGAFLFFDVIGATLWVTALLSIGRVFGDALKRDPSVLNWIGRFGGSLLILAVISFLVARLVRRRRFLKELLEARLEPAELKQLLDAGKQVFIVDLRHPLELLPDPFTLPGALHLSPEALTARSLEIPRDRDIVLYCTCPNEATAAKTAMMLHKLGIERVRPLRGGYDEWKRLGYPLAEVQPALPVAE